MSLSTCIKRKKERREEYIEQNGLIFKLPDEILLSVFKYLTIDELIVAAGFVDYISSFLHRFFSFNSVCKWFRCIAYDEELWTTIDLTSKSYSNPEHLRFVRRFPRDCTEVLKISGGLLPDNPDKLPAFTEQLNSAIPVSYPNLRYLHLSQYDFHVNQRTIKNITSFPSNLHGLYLTKCKMLPRSAPGTVSFFQMPRKKNFSFEQLEILSFENCSCLLFASITYLPNLCTKLVELNLNGCVRITPRSEFTYTLLSYSTTLRRLYLSRTQITDNTMHSICQRLKRLNILDIKQCNNVTKNIVENLLTLKQLQKLIANDDIQIVYNQRKNQVN
jgi:hypothetical protein